MAVLSNADRSEVAADFNRAVSDDHEPCAAIKADVIACANALDDFLNANAATINAAIPQPGRTNLTTAQKARIMMLVIRRRYLSGA